MTYEQVIDTDIFMREVWCSPFGRYDLLMDNGYSEDDIEDMFQEGTLFEKVMEYVKKLSPEERYSFWTMNC